MEKKENPIQKTVFKDVGSREDVRIFRNNIGMATNPDGQKIKYGLCNPGGSDLIGWTKKTITMDMIGEQVAIFTAIEVKAKGKKPTEKQKNFLKQVKKSGGIAGVAWNSEDANKIIDGDEDPIYINMASFF